MSGIGIARGDIRAKAAGWPLHRLLGGAARAIPAYAGGVALGYEPPVALTDEVRQPVDPAQPRPLAHAGRRARHGLRQRRRHALGGLHERPARNGEEIGIIVLAVVAVSRVGGMGGLTRSLPPDMFSLDGVGVSQILAWLNRRSRRHLRDAVRRAGHHHRRRQHEGPARRLLLGAHPHPVRHPRRADRRVRGRALPRHQENPGHACAHRGARPAADRARPLRLRCARGDLPRQGSAQHSRCWCC